MSNVTPMDPGAREGDNTPIAHHKRKCWAMVRLIHEVEDLFPEMAHQSSGLNGRGVALDVTFDLTTIDTDLRTPATDLLRLIRSDERVLEVMEDEEQILVSFRSSARTQDSRDPFGLDSAWLILTGEDS